MAKLFNRAKMTTATTGTGTVTLGSASIGFQTFASAGVADADVVQYVIEEGGNFEIGTGTYTATGTTLTRSPTESSNGGAAITLTGGATVSVTAIDADFNRLQHAGVDKVVATSGGATVTGTMTATAFSGDGSALTGIVSIPAGAILLWSGSIASIPSGWVLCDGLNSTPDLRDRFIVGAGSTYAVASTGGSASVTLAEAELPSHTHGAGNFATGNSGTHTHTLSGNTSSSGNHAHNGSTSNTGGHSHNVNVKISWYSGYSGGIAANLNNNVGYLNGAGYTDNQGSHSHNFSTSGAGDHSHTLSGNAAAGGDHSHSLTGTTGAAGSGSAHENRPPYYALAYIMKT